MLQSDPEARRPGGRRIAADLVLSQAHSHHLYIKMECPIFSFSSFLPLVHKVRDSTMDDYVNEKMDIVTVVEESGEFAFLTHGSNECPTLSIDRREYLDIATGKSMAGIRELRKSTIFNGSIVRLFQLWLV